MIDKFEEELQRLVQDFLAEVLDLAQQAVLRVAHSAFTGAPRTDEELVRLDSAMKNFMTDVTDLAERLARYLIQSALGGAGDRQRPVQRPRLTGDELIAVRTQLAMLIREQPGQTTAGLARGIGITSSRLRPLLRQLKDEGAIRTEERLLEGWWRLTYVADEPQPPEHEVEPPPGSPTLPVDVLPADVGGLAQLDVEDAAAMPAATLGAQ